MVQTLILTGLTKWWPLVDSYRAFSLREPPLAKELVNNSLNCMQLLYPKFTLGMKSPAHLTDWRNLKDARQFQ